MSIEAALKTLTPREEKVIRRRFGFDAPCMVLREIGLEFGVTGNRILQIQDMALRKLRHPTRQKLWQDTEFNPKLKAKLIG